MVQTVNSKRILHRFNRIVIALKYRLSYYFMFFKKNNNINKKTITGDLPPQQWPSLTMLLLRFRLCRRAYAALPFLLRQWLILLVLLIICNIIKWIKLSLFYVYNKYFISLYISCQFTSYSFLTTLMHKSKMLLLLIFYSL